MYYCSLFLNFTICFIELAETERDKYKKREKCKDEKE